MDYCPHCMRPVSGPRCAHCGKPVDYPIKPGHLPLQTPLTGSGGLRVYALGAALGQGGFGITYIAREVSTGTRVAIKECFPIQCARRGADHVTVEPKPGAEQILARAQESFLEEAKLLAHQDNLPSVVRVLDFFRANNTVYLVMEYLDGVTLQQKCKQEGRLSAQVLLPLLRPLLRDLCTLHASGVIHRDISPDNIMWMPDNTLKLLDFGCARSMEDGHSMNVVLKHGFAPVEQYQTRGQGPVTDIYALSATIDYCLTGVMPPSAVDRLEKDTLQPPTSLGADLTPEQESALLWGLEVQPRSRPGSVDQFASKLFGSEDWAKEPEKSAPVKAWSRRTKGWLLGAAAAGLVLVVGLSAAAIYAARSPADDVLGGAPANPVTTSGGLQGAPALDGGAAGTPSAAPSPAPTAAPLTGETEDGVLYEIVDSQVTLTGYAGEEILLELPSEVLGFPVVVIADEAFQGSPVESLYLPESLQTLGESAFAGSTIRDLYVYSALDAPASAFSGCTELRSVLRLQNAANPADWDLPEDCKIYNKNMETGAGSLRYLDVDDQGLVYGITDQEEAVLLSVPADVSEIVLPDEVLGYPVVWVESAALEDVDADAEGISIQLSDLAGFPYELLTRANWSVKETEKSTFAFDWYLTCATAYLINGQREVGAPQILPDRAYTEAAALRAEELTENYNLSERPDGSEWSTALDEVGAEWDHAYSRFGKAENDDVVLEEMSETAESWTASKEDGYLEQIGVGAYYDGDETFYLYFLGNIPD